LVDGQYLLRGQATTGQLDVELVAPDKVSWGQLFLLPPSETISMDYIYTLPEGTAKQVDGEWHYSLYLQKQPGTHQNAVEVAVTLPAGGQWIAGEPAPTRQEDRTLFYQFDLKQDQEIDIFYRISE
ncbi:MAG: hypothetical protein R3264_12665, partial [Anaerolineae bacterium]|nr:hypothetical protein [Anaerolineae bacterium]